MDYRLRDSSQSAFEEGGKPENLRCFAVAVGLDGTFRRTRIPLGPYRESSWSLRWKDGRTLQVTRDGRSFEVQMPLVKHLKDAEISEPKQLKITGAENALALSVQAQAEKD